MIVVTTKCCQPVSNACCIVSYSPSKQAQEAEKLSKEIEKTKRLEKEQKIISELDVLIEANKYVRYTGVTHMHLHVQSYM